MMVVVADNYLRQQLSIGIATYFSAQVGDAKRVCQISENVSD